MKWEKASYGISYNGKFYERNKIEIGGPDLHNVQRIYSKEKQSRTKETSQGPLKQVRMQKKQNSLDPARTVGGANVILGRVLTQP